MEGLEYLDLMTEFDELSRNGETSRASADYGYTPTSLIRSIGDIDSMFKFPVGNEPLKASNSYGIATISQDAELLALILLGADPPADGGESIPLLDFLDSAFKVFLLDEVDKIGMDFRGDPSSALLEVLDPEQNHTFMDHYLEVDFDLSEVLFITTSNFEDAIPLPLFDRMEIIRLSGYLEFEKVGIAERHLIPKQMDACGLTKKHIEFDQKAILIKNQYNK